MNKKKFLSLVLTLALVFVAQVALTQGPPDPPVDPSSGGGPIGGSGSIEGGIGFLVAMATAWGSRKLYQLKKKSQELE